MIGILGTALSLITSGDTDLWQIVLLSLRVSLTATLLSAALALPLAALIATRQFAGKRAVLVIANALMALPPVVVGLAVYLLLSRSGPLGSWGLLFTPTAMIIAQSVLVFPILVSLGVQAIEPLYREYQNLFETLAVSTRLQITTLLWDARYALSVALLAGFGRALAEVGAVIIVGGNINGATRVMTTTIALETSKGNLELALGLGIILVGIAILVNALTHALSARARRFQEAQR